MGILQIGKGALQANSVALQTAGNNIANVNTPGYSRQRTVLNTVLGQYTSAGYIGKGVAVATIQRNFSEFLTRQVTLATATASADVTRADKLGQLEGIFEGGPTGLGASINDMLNSFADVASAPTDLTARTVTLTRIDETAARMRSASQRLDDLQLGITQELGEKVSAVNALARSIADVNKEITKAQGQGQLPNDLLDQRDQLVRELNRYVQTTSVLTGDGTMGIFIGGAQALVLGIDPATISIVKDDFGDAGKSRLAVTRAGISTAVDDSALGGGEIPGLIRFQNDDLNEARNLLGRLTLAITSSMNDQHRLGLDLQGNQGGDLFSQPTFNGLNVLVPKQFPPPAPNVRVNSGTSNISMSISDATQFVASDYEMVFEAPGTAGSIIRRSDGVVTAFDFATTNPVVVDGISISQSAGPASPGDRFLLKPFSTSASTITSQFSTPRALAVASPVVGIMGVTNAGSLQQVSVIARGPNPPNPPSVPFTPVVLTFTTANTYTRSDDVSATVFTYTPGESIEGTLPDLPPTAPLMYSNPLNQWAVKLQGEPRIGDTFTIQAIRQTNADYKLNAGAALAMTQLRDVAMFDGAALTDGYAGLISQIGIRTQSANFAASVSTSIATNVEKDHAAVSGVNLDEEAAKLIQFQQAYQASAKMIQIAQSIFDTLIQSVGR